MFEDLTLIGLVSKGGITVAVLAVFSVVSVAIMLERAWSFRRFRLSLRGTASDVRKAIGEGGDPAAIGRVGGPLSNVALSGYLKRDKGKSEVLGAMELSARGEIQGLERYLGVLGTIGSTAPFVGLFGTVLGIIRAFSDLAVSGGASPAAVADGIAEALVATAAGLFVAVPSVMAYNYFVRSLSRAAFELEVASKDIAESIVRGE